MQSARTDGNASSSADKSRKKNELSDGDLQVLRCMVGATLFHLLEGCTSWDSLEEHVAGLPKPKIMNLLKAVLDPEAYKKTESWKSQTSRESMAGDFVSSIRAKVDDTKS